MRILLVTALLMVAVLLLYESTIGGDAGAGRLLQERAGGAPMEIGGIEP